MFVFAGVYRFYVFSQGFLMVFTRGFDGFLQVVVDGFHVLGLFTWIC